MSAIVFDLDGTLVQFDRPYRAILERALESVAGRARADWLESYDEAFFARFERFDPDPVENAFRAIGATGDPSELAAALLEAEIEASVTPPGVHADLERLGESHRLAVLTNGVPAWQRAKLAAQELGSSFDLVVASYEVGAHKPHPEPFRAVEERLGAGRYAIVGDSDDDIEGGEAAGWATVPYESGGFGDLPAAIDWPPQ